MRKGLLFFMSQLFKVQKLKTGSEVPVKLPIFRAKALPQRRLWENG